MPVISPAFTLVEMLVVISIIGLLAAIAIPTINSMRPNPVVAATRQLLDDVGRARQLAISQRTTVYMVFISTNLSDSFMNAHPSPSAADQAMVTNLYDKQLTGYTFVSLRSIGDQPGQGIPRYLAGWRTLPQGSYISPEKFSNPTNLVLNIYTNGSTQPAFQVFGFNAANNIPFPFETNSTSSSWIFLPYVAFNGLGQCISGPNGQPELIPLTQGNLLFPRDASTKVAQAGIPQFIESPPGNHTNNYSLVSIDALTGRAHIEYKQVQ